MLKYNIIINTYDKSIIFKRKCAQKKKYYGLILTTTSS